MPLEMSKKEVELVCFCCLFISKNPSGYEEMHYRKIIKFKGSLYWKVSDLQIANTMFTDSPYAVEFAQASVAVTWRRGVAQQMPIYMIKHDVEMIVSLCPNLYQMIVL